MVRRLYGKALVAIIMALILGLPVMAGGAEFDLGKFNQELGLNFAYGKNTKKATVQLLLTTAPLGHVFGAARPEAGSHRPVLRG